MEEKSNFVMLSVVAIVAIVALVVLVTGTTKVYTPSTTVYTPPAFVPNEQNDDWRAFSEPLGLIPLPLGC